MGSLAPQNSPAAQIPFFRFVLAPQDDGMNTMQNVDAVVNGLDADDLWKMSDNLPKVKWFKNTCILPSEILLHMIPNIVYKLAVTQKVTLSGMLALGVRYIEFRPACLKSLFQDISLLEDKIYFQHACVPGLAYDGFLEQTSSFLETHSAENCPDSYTVGWSRWRVSTTCIAGARCCHVRGHCQISCSAPLRAFKLLERAYRPASQQRPTSNMYR